MLGHVRSKNAITDLSRTKRNTSATLETSTKNEISLVELGVAEAN